VITGLFYWFFVGGQRATSAASLPVATIQHAGPAPAGAATAKPTKVLLCSKIVFFYTYRSISLEIVRKAT